MNTALADSARPRAGWPSSGGPVWVARHPQPHHGAVAGAEDVLDAEPEVGHGRDDHGHEIGSAARAVAVAEQLDQIVPDEGRIEQLSGAVADGAVIDRLHSVADCGDGIVDHDHSVPDRDRCRHLEADLAGAPTADTCAVGLVQRLSRSVIPSRGRRAASLPIRRCLLMTNSLWLCGTEPSVLASLATPIADDADPSGGRSASDARWPVMGRSG